MNEIYDLFIDLDATEEQLDFPVLYTNARTGTASIDPDDGGRGSAAAVRRGRRTRAAAARQHRRAAATAGGEPRLQRLPRAGSPSAGSSTAASRSAIRWRSCKLDTAVQHTKVTKLYAFDGLKRVDIEEAAAGDIVCLAGIEDITIGETITDMEHRSRFRRSRSTSRRCR